MIFYHGTNEEAWLKIIKEGVLWGVHSYRYTYLTPEINIAKEYGSVLLEVDYIPTGIRGIDNYGFDPPPGMICWQFSVFIPISISKVKRIL
jgi:hypothetical protein